MQKKTGTLKDLEQDMKDCGFHPMSVEEMVAEGLCAPDMTDVGKRLCPSGAENSTPPDTRDLDTVIAVTRMQLDNAMQDILRQSGLPLYLFDLLIDSVQKDIRKADLDILRSERLTTSLDGASATINHVDIAATTGGNTTCE